MKLALWPLAALTGLAFGLTTAVAQQQPGKAQQAPSAKETTQDVDQTKAMTQSKLRNALREAGFQDIRIVDATYLVQAQTKDGDNVMMFINPPSVSSTQASGSAAAKPGTSSSSK